MLLKPNMVLSGKDCPQQASMQEVVEATVAAILFVRFFRIGGSKILAHME
jgi:fructose-bisphosphate aldolase class 1